MYLEVDRFYAWYTFVWFICSPSLEELLIFDCVQRSDPLINDGRVDQITNNNMIMGTLPEQLQNWSIWKWWQTCIGMTPALSHVRRGHQFNIIFLEIYSCVYNQLGYLCRDGMSGISIWSLCSQMNASSLACQDTDSVSFIRQTNPCPVFCA